MTHWNRREFISTTVSAGAAWTAGATPLAPPPEIDVAAIEARVRANRQIQDARDAAMAVLQPSARELERGLELHANSLVFDAYGFSPRSALDGERLRAAIEAGAAQTELNDLREDMAMTRCVESADEHQEYVDAWHASGVTCVFQNAGEEGQDPLRLVKRLARFTYVTDFLRDFVFRASRPEEILQAQNSRRHCLYFTGNGVPLTQQWQSVEDEFRYIRVFFQLGIRMMHLTYNRRNMLGDGCAEPSNAGLSDFGRAAISEMNRLGIIVDVAHSGWRTSLEAAQVSGQPVVASHSAAGGLNEHIRSKPDEVVRAIADSGGYIGVCCIPRFLGGSGDIAAFLDHIDYVVRRFGADHVAIGTDVAYMSRNSAAENRKAGPMPKQRSRWAALWPPDPFQTTPRQVQTLAWTNWPLFTVGLVQRGHSDDVIRKIIGGNVLRVAQAVLKSHGRTS